MNKCLRALVGIGLWLAVYLIAVYLMPSLGIVRRAIDAHTWLSNGEISQVTFLILSFLLILIFARGDWSVYGLRGVRAGQLVRPVIMAIGVSLFFFVLSAVVMMISGPPDEMGGPAMSKGLVNFVLTVVLLASICEEIFSRGLIQGFLAPLKNMGVKLGKVHISLPVTICGLLFGLGHLCLWGNMDSRIVILIIISAMVLGFIAGYFREKTDSLVPAIVVHMTFNVVSGVIPRLLMGAVSG